MERTAAKPGEKFPRSVRLGALVLDRGNITPETSRAAIPQHRANAEPTPNRRGTNTARREPPTPSQRQTNAEPTRSQRGTDVTSPSISRRDGPLSTPSLPDHPRTDRPSGSNRPMRAISAAPCRRHQVDKPIRMNRAGTAWTLRDGFARISAETGRSTPAARRPRPSRSPSCRESGRAAWMHVATTPARPIDAASPPPVPTVNPTPSPVSRSTSLAGCPKHREPFARSFPRTFRQDRL